MPERTPQRIALLTDSLARGGAERQCLLATRQLAARGLQVDLIYYHEVEDRYDASLAGDARLDFLEKRRQYGRFILRLANRLRRGRYDVLHAFKGSPAIYAAFAGSLARIPVIVGAHRVEFRGAGVYRQVLKQADRFLDAWVENSSASAQALQNRLGVRQDKCFVVYNGIEPTSFVSSLTPAEAKQRLQYPLDTPVVLILARLYEQKNHQMFLHVAQQTRDRLPNTRFLVVGDGPLEDALRKQATQLGISDRVDFIGSRQDIADILAATDVSVLTSEYECLANAMVESMAAGVSVVTTDYDGHDEVVEDAVEGYVVPRGNVVQMADRLTRLINDEALRIEMGQRGRARVERQFGLEAMTDALLDVYHQQWTRRRSN